MNLGKKMTLELGQKINSCVYLNLYWFVHYDQEDSCKHGKKIIVENKNYQAGFG